MGRSDTSRSRARDWLCRSVILYIRSPRAELMDADFHNGWTPVRARRWCPFIAARHLVRARRSTQLAEVHSSDKQWNEVLDIPLIEEEEEEEEGGAEDAGEQEEEVEADEEIGNGNETVGTKRAREED